MVNYYQFARFVEVEILDFNSNVNTIIGNEFEIDFEYFKSLDQTVEDDSGRILIYGLTDERIELLQTGGREVRLTCGYLNYQTDLLFVANISRIYSRTTNNISVTTIECSANLLNHYYTPESAYHYKSGDTLADSANTFGTMLNARDAKIVLPKEAIVNDYDRESLKTFINTFVVKANFFGTIEKMLQEFCYAFKLMFRREHHSDGTFSVVFEVSPLGINNMLKIIDSGYSGKESSNTDRRKVFINTLKENEEEVSKAIFLSSKSGLIEAKKEYIISEYSVGSLTNSNQTEVLSVKRNFSRIKALLNPLAKPQTQIFVFESSEVNIKDEDKKYITGTRALDSKDVSDTDELNGQYLKYRVRSITYKGNNKKGDWVMEAYCEDSSIGLPITENEVREILRRIPSEDVKIENLEQEQYEASENIDSSEGLDYSQ